MKISILLVLTILLVYVDMTYSKPGTPDDDIPAVMKEPAAKRGSKSDYTISLRRGRKISRASTPWFKWTKPLSPGSGGPCSWQGVLRATQPPWAKSFVIHMIFWNSHEYSFHIGDSPSNRGWGHRTAGTTRWNSEMYSYNNKRYLLYANNYYFPAFARKRADINNAIQQQAWIIIRKHQVKFWPGFGPLQMYTIQNRLFRFTSGNNIYVGVNRIIKNKTGAPSFGRTGRGLCFIGLTWRDF